MKAVVTYPRKRGSIEMIEIERPKVAPGTVLIAMRDVGIDGTDLEVIGGAHGGVVPAGSAYLILGHESLGQIQEVGRGVSGFFEGDWVVCTVRRPDGCPNCRRGESDMCLWGGYTERGIKGAHGYLAEVVVERPEFMVRVPPRLSSVGALVEPLSINVKAIEQAWTIQARMRWEPRTALVFGLGTIGILGAMLLAKRGLDVTMYSRDSPRSKKARMIKEIGIDYISAQDTPRVADLAKRFERIDFMLEATGAAAVAAHAMLLIPANGVLCLLSVTGTSKRLPLDVAAINQRLVLGNGVVFGSVNSNRTHFTQALRELDVFDQRWPGFMERLISRRVPLAQYQSAFETRDSDIKVLIQVSAPGRQKGRRRRRR